MARALASALALSGIVLSALVLDTTALASDTASSTASVPAITISESPNTTSSASTSGSEVSETFIASGAEANANYSWVITPSTSGSSPISVSTGTSSTSLVDSLSASVSGSSYDTLTVSGAPTSTAVLDVTASANSSLSASETFTFDINPAPSVPSANELSNVPELFSIGSSGGSTGAQQGSSGSAATECTSASSPSTGSCYLTTPNGHYNTNFGTLGYSYEASAQELTVTIPSTYGGQDLSGATLFFCYSASSTLLNGLNEPANWCNASRGAGPDVTYESQTGSSSSLSYSFRLPSGDYWFFEFSPNSPTSSYGTLEAAGSYPAPVLTSLSCQGGTVYNLGQNGTVYSMQTLGNDPGGNTSLGVIFPSGYNGLGMTSSTLYAID